MLFTHKRHEPAVRLSVSIESGLASYVRQTAKAANVSLSAVVSDALRLHLQKAMVTGLLEDASESLP